MIVKILIDSRESKLFGILNERDLDNYKDKIIIEKQQLDVGDIHIIFNEIIYIYERKTIPDLLSSIKDGRYKEQKIRLLASCRNNNYIIEGDTIISNKDFKNQKTLTSVYLNSIYRDNINVFFTNDINDTATFILLFVSKIIDKPENYLNKSDGTPVAAIPSGSTLKFAAVTKTISPSIATPKVKTIVIPAASSWNVTWESGALVTVNNGGATTKLAYGEINLKNVANKIELTATMRLNDQYVYGISEVSSAWPSAAIQAQAIASRTYGLSRMGSIRKECDCNLYNTK